MTVYRATCTAFEGHRRIASGALSDVALAVRAVLARGEQAPVLIFDDATSHPVEFDLRGTPEEIVARLAAEHPSEEAEAAQTTPASDATAEDAPRGRGRPKLGVVAREVTLLPRHWDWLNGQPGGASVALRKLVEAARVAGEHKDRQRAAQEAVYRFMTALAGNLPGYEDATRALYADDRPRFEAFVAAWPEDVRNHTLRLASRAFVEQT
ncbi:DUF2239 family protein [Paraburkholderia sp. DD10]|jgi:hypothetical protein|uniref:DUF2239 domain-containing protein n=1 Tax=Paraburkholderia terricola TaxID=169427 RepID=A0A1M6Z3Z2_9BURK|nr:MULTISPECIES: DUF2239 family protein [Paraburkholderia]SDP45447.1 hypothetical protein SAMN05192547_10914 [Paraburkholderia sediminicola]SHL25211.1 hypothetical protein SAMN05192548_10883 [Paraburkholderia terricola]